MNGLFSDEKESRSWKEYRLQVVSCHVLKSGLNTILILSKWSTVNLYRSRCEEKQILASNDERILLYVNLPVSSGGLY